MEMYMHCMLCFTPAILCLYECVMGFKITHGQQMMWYILWNITTQNSDKDFDCVVTRTFKLLEM